MALNLNYYTMVAAIEAGTSRIPPDHFVAYAKALDCSPPLFIRKMMAYADPITYEGLWGKEYISMTELMGA